MPSRIQITTPRLTLVGANDALLRAAIDGRSVLAKTLNATVSSEWPPEHLDEAALRWALDASENMPADAVWRMYLITLRSTLADPLAGIAPIAIGTCGFKGAPDCDGQVEVGYSIVPSHQRNGYATEATRALMALAYRHGARTVIAETYPELVASRRVMEKCGMVLGGEGSEPGVIRYAHHHDLIGQR